MPKVLKNFLFSLGLERCANGICACQCGGRTYCDLVCCAVLLTAVIYAVLNVARNALVEFVLTLVFVHHFFYSPYRIVKTLGVFDY